MQTQAVYLPNWALGPTVVTVDLSYENPTQVMLFYILRVAFLTNIQEMSCPENIAMEYSCFIEAGEAPHGVNPKAVVIEASQKQ